jgi:hypothetical protein
MRRHPRRARVDPTKPQAWATSDRTGFIGNHVDLQWQYEWAGTQLINKRILVYSEEMDKPQRQLGTLILPPDPVPIINARPEQYDIDEKTYRRTMDGTPRVTMTGIPRIESNLQSGSSQ